MEREFKFEVGKFYNLRLDWGDYGTVPAKLVERWKRTLFFEHYKRDEKSGLVVKFRERRNCDKWAERERAHIGRGMESFAYNCPTFADETAEKPEDWDSMESEERGYTHYKYEVGKFYDVNVWHDRKESKFVCECYAVSDSDVHFRFIVKTSQGAGYKFSIHYKKRIVKYGNGDAEEAYSENDYISVSPSLSVFERDKPEGWDEVKRRSELYKKEEK